MTVTAKVKKRMIDNGRLVHAIVQGESNATTIVFRIEGEADLVASESLYLYLLYKRPNDQTVQLPILLDYTIEDGVIVASFTPGAYFTAQDGVVEISIIATESTAELGGSGEVTNTLLWSSFPAWLIVAPSQLADSSTIIEENVFTQYLAQLEALNTDAEDYASDAEEYAKGERTDGKPVTHGSDNAKYYKNLAKDWAMKTGGPVEGVEMSAKVYAASSQSYATESQQWANKMDGKVLGTDYSSKYYASDAKSSAQSAEASADIVSAHAAAIDAIGADITNIDAVAEDLLGEDSAIEAVAGNIAKVNAVADNETNINAVNANKTNIDTVAGSATNVGTVASNVGNVNAVAGNATNINAVNANKTNIDTVAGKASEITTVAGKANEVATVAGIASDVSKVAAVDDDVTAVAAIDSDVSAVGAVASDVTAVVGSLTEISDIATDLNDEDSVIKAVGADMAGVSAVAADLTNIDAVAADLANIDAADEHALEAEGWANGTQNGTPVSSGSPYYENNAKYWADAVPNLNNALTAIDHRVQNLEQAKGDYVVSNYKDGSVTPSGKGNWAVVEGLRGVSRVENMLANVTRSATFTEKGITFTLNADGSWTFSGTPSSSGDVLFGTLAPPNGHSCILLENAKASAWAVAYGAWFRSSADRTNEWRMVTENQSGSANLNFTITAEAVGTSISGSFRFQYKDISLYFNGTIPSDADTIAEIQTNYPWLLLPSEYGTRIVDAGYSGVRAWGKNLISGFQVGKDWALLSNPERACFRLDNPSYIGKAMVLSATWPSTVNTIRVVRIRDANVRPNSFTYEEPISIEIVGNVTMTQAIVDECKAQLELGSTATAYSPYMENTLSFPSTTLKSAGSVREKKLLNVEVEIDGQKVQKSVKTNPIGSYTFVGNETWGFYAPPDNRFFFGGLSDVIKKIPVTELGNVLLEGFTPQTADRQYSQHNEYSVATDNLGRVFIYVASWVGKTTAEVASLMAGKTIYFELATPDPDTYSDPIIDNTLLTESGGRISTVQTGTVVDGIADLGFITL